MKLIIDIPDNEYRQICELRLHNRTFYDDAIRNGTSLEKIRAEIEAEKIGYPPNADEYKTINKVLQIIDKYRKEQE